MGSAEETEEEKPPAPREPKWDFDKDQQIRLLRPFGGLMFGPIKCL